MIEVEGFARDGAARSAARVGITLLTGSASLRSGAITTTPEGYPNEVAGAGGGFDVVGGSSGVTIAGAEPDGVSDSGVEDELTTGEEVGEEGAGGGGGGGGRNTSGKYLEGDGDI